MSWPNSSLKRGLATASTRVDTTTTIEPVEEDCSRATARRPPSREVFVRAKTLARLTGTRRGLAGVHASRPCRDLKLVLEGA
jgi:hypothetical protein